MTHDLKVWPEFWQAIDRGSKPFELRKDDRGFRVGDELRLREWDPSFSDYTGNATTRYVTYIVRDAPQWGLEPGFAILGLARSPFRSTP